MNRFSGTGVALITPFKADLSIDLESLHKITDNVIKNGVDYLVIMGTTAESATLSEEEKTAIIQVILETNNGRVPTVIGIGGNNTVAVSSCLKNISRDKFDAVLSVTPYYNRPSQKGLYLHYKALAEASSLPIILYNVPSRTACNILPETVIQLAKDCNTIIGIKEACGDIIQTMKLLKNKPKDFLVFSGDDMTALPSVSAGCSGVISVMANALPKVFSSMIRLGLQNKTHEAYRYQYALMDIIGLTFEEINPVGVKAILSLQKICSQEVRLPLVSVSPGLKTRLEECLNALPLPAE